MEKKYQISELIQESMAKVREMADTNRSTPRTA